MNTRIGARWWIAFTRPAVAPAAALLLCLAAGQGIAQTYRVLHDFTDADGAHPFFAGLLMSGTTLYGTTESGGSSNAGTVFRLNTDGSGYTVLKHFTGSDGSGPAGTMALSGSTLYGTTEYGGTSNVGTVFKLGTDGSGYTVLKHFSLSDGFWPCGGLLLAGATLYGTTFSGGDLGWGTVFKLKTDGTGYTVLKSFTLGSREGGEPIAGLVLSGATLYGTTSLGTTNGGSAFCLNTDGSGFEVLKELNGSDGLWPCSPLLLAGTTLYGTADWGGLGGGTLFRLNTNGTGFTVLKSLNAREEGAGVEAGLLLSGSALYGMAYEGGDHPYGPPDYGNGTVFRVNTDGTGFVVLKAFNGSDGANPRAGLVLSGTTLYGMTDYGGNANCGVIFALSMPVPTILNPPQTQTAEAGSRAYFGVDAGDDPSLTYQWFFNGTNALGNATTNWDLELTGIQPSQAGPYTVVVSNLFGAATSPPAMLGVIASVPRRTVPAVKLLGEAGSSLNLEYASALGPGQNWLPLGALGLTSASRFYFELSEPLPPQRFFRAWRTGLPGVAPALEAHLVPAITLTGAVGGSLRLDYINVYGPLGAWTTLDTVTLTNASQLYFDVSVIGQPERLWRIVPLP